MGAKQNNARPLVERIWGQNWIEAIPLKWRSALKYFNIKIPGVNNETMPDEIGGSDGVINSQVTTNRINELEKVTSKLDTTVVQHVYHEQDYDEQFDVVVPTDSYLTAEGAELGLPHRIIEGLTPGIDRVKTISPDTSVLDNYLLYFPGTQSIELPDILEGVSAILERTSGDGFSDETGSGAWSGQGSYAFSLQTTNQASAAIMPDVDVRITTPWTRNVQTTHYLFFLPVPVTLNAVLTKLVALVGKPIEPWPVFKPRTETVYCIGQRTAIEVKAMIHVQDGGSDSGSEFSQSQGTGYSTDVALSVKIVRIPSTIHNDISLGGELSGSVDLSASASQVTSGSVSASATITKTGSVFGRTTALIKKTAGDYVIPDSGLRLMSTNVEPYKWGYAIVRAVVVDFAVVNYGASVIGSGEGTAPTIAYNAVSSLQDHSVRINGAVGTGGLSTTYHVEYGLTTGYGTSTTPVTIPGSVSAQVVAITVSSLTAATLYHYRIVATNAQGTTNGADRQFTTHTYPAFNRFIYFKVKIDHLETDNGGNSFDYIQLNDSVGTFTVGLYTDNDAHVWHLYEDDGMTESTIDGSSGAPVTFKDQWHSVQIGLNSNGENLTIDFAVDGVAGSATLSLAAGQLFNRFYAGAKSARTSTLAKRTFDDLRIGRTSLQVDIFDGEITGTVIPPYDSVTGSGVTVNAGTKLHAETTGSTQTYAAKTTLSTT